jgi:hypothetical protein
MCIKYLQDVCLATPPLGVGPENRCAGVCAGPAIFARTCAGPAILARTFVQRFFRGKIAKVRGRSGQ